jgi:uncharacterized protein YukE
MVNGFKADTLVMKGSAAHVLTVADAVRSSADSMLATLSGMIWIGDAASAFNAAKDGLADELAAISISAGNLSSTLRDHSVTYTAADGAAYVELNKVAAALRGA